MATAAISIIIALVIASYLIIIAYTLSKVSFILGTVLVGVRSISHQTQPLSSVVGAIARNVGGIQQTLAGLVRPGQAVSSRR